MVSDEIFCELDEVSLGGDIRGQVTARFGMASPTVYEVTLLNPEGQLKTGSHNRSMWVEEDLLEHNALLSNTSSGGEPGYQGISVAVVHVPNIFGF